MNAHDEHYNQSINQSIFLSQVADEITHPRPADQADVEDIQIMIYSSSGAKMMYQEVTCCYLTRKCVEEIMKQLL